LIALILISGCGDGASSGSTNTSTQTGENTATLSWDPPTSNQDGTPLAGLAGFRVYYAQTTPDTAFDSQVVSIDDGTATTETISNLSAGTYYFVVAATDINGNESEMSNEVSKTIQ
jgi:uncharacterized protein (DUF2141 family)